MIDQMQKVLNKKMIYLQVVNLIRFNRVASINLLLFIFIFTFCSVSLGQKIEVDYEAIEFIPNKKFEIEIRFRNNTIKPIVFDKCIAANVLINSELPLLIYIQSEFDTEKKYLAAKGSFNRISGDNISGECKENLEPGADVKIKFDLFKEFNFEEQKANMKGLNVIVGLSARYRFYLDNNDKIILTKKIERDLFLLGTNEYNFKKLD